jgi:hypothetical protein
VDCFQVTCPACGAAYVEPMYVPPINMPSILVASRCPACYVTIGINVYWTMYDCIEAVAVATGGKQTDCEIVEDPNPVFAPEPIN